MLALNCRRSMPQVARGGAYSMHKRKNDTWTWTLSDTIHGKRTNAKDRPHSKARAFSSWQTYLTKSQDAKATGPEQRTLGSASPKVRYTETVTPTIRPRLWRHSSGIFLAIVGWFLLIKGSVAVCHQIHTIHHALHRKFTELSQLRTPAEEIAVEQLQPVTPFAELALQKTRCCPEFRAQKS